MVPLSIEYDMFCSGHSFLGDGRPFTVGGEDHVEGTIGQSISYILNTDEIASGPPQWTEAPTSLASDERWYPTVVTLPDGRMLTTGDTPCHPVIPNDCGPAHEGYGDFYHQVYDPANAGWGLLRPNQEELTPCTTPLDLHIQHYPRLHVLANGWIMHVDGKASTGDPSHVAWFLWADDAPSVADCDLDLGTEYYNKWVEGDRIPGDVREAAQKGAPSVHMLWPEPGFPLTYHEVVYQFGGHWEPHDDGAACPAPWDGVHYPSDRVARMTDPDPSKYWDDGVPAMPEGRVNHNAVILLDGSILLVGGEDYTAGGFQYRTTPTVFRPEEFFGGSGSYYAMAAQSDLRRYHSVAGLLPDGRVFSAGGAREGAFIGDPFSVELFSPPYLFSSPPPVIDTVDSPSWSYAQIQQLDVTVPSGGTVDRVALVRVGSSTHAFDASQRYVELLPALPPADQGNNWWKLTVHTPPNGRVAPPGWYMLTVATQVDGYPFTGSAKYVPSEATWIKME